MLFTDVGYNCYIQTKKIKFVISSTDNKAYTTLIKKAEESNTLLNITFKKATLSIVVLEDDTVLRSPITAETIAKRLVENGHYLLQVESGYFVSVIHIKAITEKESAMVAALKKISVKVGSELQFVRQRSKSNSVLLMTTGELISLSKYTKDLVNDIDKLFITSPNNV